MSERHCPKCGATNLHDLAACLVCGADLHEGWKARAESAEAELAALKDPNTKVRSRTWQDDELAKGLKIIHEQRKELERLRNLPSGESDELHSSWLKATPERLREELVFQAAARKAVEAELERVRGEIAHLDIDKAEEIGTRLREQRDEARTMLHGARTELESVMAGLLDTEQERDEARAKAEQFEKDWMEAKHEFGNNMAKARGAIDEARADADRAGELVSELNAALGEKEHELERQRAAVDAFRLVYIGCKGLGKRYSAEDVLQCLDGFLDSPVEPVRAHVVVCTSKQKDGEEWYVYEVRSTKHVEPGDVLLVPLEKP